MVAERKIIVIDGECSFCNKTAAFILKRNKSKDILFASSESDNGKVFIEKNQIQFDPKKTLIFVKGNRVYDRSSAALQIAKSMSGLYPAMLIFWIIPKFIRDTIYNFIAKHRYKIISKKDICSIASMQSFEGRII